MRKTALRIGAFLLLAAVGPAQTRDHGFTVKFGGGYTPTMGHTGGRLDNGWNILAGAGYNFNQRFGVLGEFNYNEFGVNQRVLNSVGAPGGDANVWSITAQPHLKLTPSESRFGAYLTVGGGFYRRTVNFTQPSTSVVTVYDPWWGYFSDVLVPSNQLLGQRTSNAGGVNGGAGVSCLLSARSGVRVFAEAKYHHAFTNGAGTNYIPVTVGLSW